PTWRRPWTRTADRHVLWVMLLGIVGGLCWLLDLLRGHDIALTVLLIASSAWLAITTSSERRRRRASIAELPGPLNRWGRLIAPDTEVGAFMMIKKARPIAGRSLPPRDAYRMWHQRPGTPVDDDLSNWTVWGRPRNISDIWANSGFEVDEWLPE